MFLAAALIVGCGIGTLGAYVVDLLDGRVRTISEIRKLIDLPVIGIIPQFLPGPKETAPTMGLLSHVTPRSCSLSRISRPGRILSSSDAIAVLRSCS